MGDWRLSKKGAWVDPNLTPEQIDWVLDVLSFLKESDEPWKYACAIGKVEAMTTIPYFKVKPAAFLRYHRDCEVRIVFSLEVNGKPTLEVELDRESTGTIRIYRIGRRDVVYACHEFAR
jgi:hypothetical protein